jgi:hypothetical protein
MKFTLRGTNQNEKLLEKKINSNGRQLQIIKIEYLRNHLSDHLSDLSQIKLGGPN